MAVVNILSYFLLVFLFCIFTIVGALLHMKFCILLFYFRTFPHVTLNFLCLCRIPSCLQTGLLSYSHQVYFFLLLTPSWVFLCIILVHNFGQADLTGPTSEGNSGLIPLSPRASVFHIHVELMVPAPQGGYESYQKECFG